MKQILKLSLTSFFILTAFLSSPEKLQRITVEASQDIMDNDLVLDEVRLTVDAYLREYLEEFPANDLELERNNQKEYLVRKLKADGFTEAEIATVFEIIENDRIEKIIELANSYLEEDQFLSKKALISKFDGENYSQREIEQALESIDIDWREQAVKASEEYINTTIDSEEESYSITSRKCLQQFLIEEKHFTIEEVTYGMEESTINWEEQAFKQAKYYLTQDTYSKKSLIKKLVADEFSYKEAEYAVAKTQTDWKKQATKKAESYLVDSLLQSKKSLIRFLQQEGFTKEEIDYAVNLLFKDTNNDQTDVEKPNAIIPEVSAPERPIVIKPLEFITSHVGVLEPVVTNRQFDLKDSSFNQPRSTITRKRQSFKKDPSRPVAEKVIEQEDVEETSLFDNPVFLPVIMVLVVGNLYLFQKS